MKSKPRRVLSGSNCGSATSETPDDLPGAFAAAVREGHKGLLTTIESIFVVHRARIVELAARVNPEGHSFNAGSGLSPLKTC
jgi:hypothetical protein